jgi:hypothetical protein
MDWESKEAIIAQAASESAVAAAGAAGRTTWSRPPSSLKVDQTRWSNTPANRAGQPRWSNTMVQRTGQRVGSGTAVAAGVAGAGDSGAELATGPDGRAELRSEVPGQARIRHGSNVGQNGRGAGVRRRIVTGQGRPPPRECGGRMAGRHAGRWRWRVSYAG